MPDTEANEMRLAQFCAQRSPSMAGSVRATHDALLDLIREARRRAELVDGRRNALSLRLRELGGLIRTAGDLAAISGSSYLEPAPLQRGPRARSIDRRTDSGDLWIAPRGHSSGCQRVATPIDGLLHLERASRSGAVFGRYG